MLAPTRVRGMHERHHVMVAIDKPRLSTQNCGVPKICPSRGK